ncbi:MAG: hypothetical protein PVF85_05195 [Anaerolineales bacterium]|jgi:hypothetical protein
MTKAEVKKLVPKGELVFIVLVLFSYAGMALHNYVELPGMSPLNPQYLLPIAIYVILTVAWLRPNNRRRWTWLTFLWGVIQLFVGAGLSVLPLSIWPFYPEQSTRHYLVHAAYGIAQIPLLSYTGALLMRPQWARGGDIQRNQTR